jgi:hypothetical protein
MTPEEFRTIGHQEVDWIADYRSHVVDRRSWHAPHRAK